ncbi:hypothetical protein ABPG74_007104 [Tetrahymena malaccensis]
MNSNLTLTNGQICSPNLTGNELIFIKRPLIIKKPNNANHYNTNIQSQSNTNVNSAIQNRSMISTSNNEQSYGQTAQDNLLTPQQKQANQFQTDQNKARYNKYPRDSSLHSQSQQRKSFVMVTEKNSGVENKEILNGDAPLQYSQVYNVQTHKNIQKQLISQRYLINNVTLSNNVMDANLLIKRPPSASLNQKNKHQITVFQQQQLSFLNSQQQNLSNGLNKKLTTNNIQPAAAVGHQNQVYKGNQFSYKQKQKITSDNRRQDKNENNFNKKEDVPLYFMDNSADSRQVIFYKDNNPSYTQRLLKERNEQQIIVSSKTQSAYQSSRNQNKYLSNSTLRKKDPNFLRESDEHQKQKIFQVNYQSLEKPSILNKTQLTNSYFIDSSIVKSPQMSSQKSQQNLTTSSKQIKTYQLDKLMTNTNHKNQFQQNNLSPYLQPSNVVKHYETNQKNSNSNSPKNSNRFRYLDDSNLHDERDDQSLQLQNSYIEIFSSDLSKFKQTATKFEQHTISEQEQLEKSINSSDSLDSSRKNQQRKHALAVSCVQNNNEQKKNQSAQNQKQKQTKQNKTFEFQKEAKIVNQEPPNKTLSQNQEHRILQLRYKLLEVNEKATARKILVKKKSIAKQKSANLCQLDDKNSSDLEEHQEKIECQQPKITTKSINKQNRITKKASYKKQESNIISSTSQVELTHVKSQKIENEFEAPQQKRKFSENRGTSSKRPPLPLSTNTKKNKKEEGFEEEDDDFPSLSNLSEIENQFDNLEFEDQEDDENQNDQDQNQEKVSSNSIHSSNRDQTGSMTELAIKKEIIMNKPLPVVTLLKSIYEGRPSTIFFEYPDCCFKKREQGNRTYVASPKEVKKWNLTYRMNDCNRPYQCVTKSFEAGGFVETLSNTQWNGYWASNRISFIKKLNSFQKTNHFAGCWNLGRKDQLWMRVSKQKRKFNEDYDFIPRTMLLGQEWDRFNTLLEDNPETLWIVKPVASCCGKGVHVVQKKCNIAKRKRKHYLASEYISNPHLINDTKYDLRIYVLVTSYDPLRIYMFEDGLVRFATEKYNLTQNGHQRQRFMHLTNYSVNKKSENFVKNSDVNDSGQGSKWSLKAWKEYLIQSIGLEAKDLLLKKMEDVIIKTCIAVEPYMNDSSSKTAQHRNNCFELYGFDILIDNTLKPWLLEVNVCPSLSSSSPLDRKIKTSLISDIFNTLGFVPYDKKKLSQEKKFSNRNQKKKKTRYSININKVIKEEQEQEQGNINMLSPRVSQNLNCTNTNFQQNVQNSLTVSTSAISNQTTVTSGFNLNSTAQQTNINLEDKKNFSKNIKDIVDLNENNCFQKLSYDDWEILFESDEEKYRCGDFKRIFPSSDINLVDYYSQFFLFPRYNNIMLWNFLKCNINMLEYICQKSTTTKC